MNNTGLSLKAITEASQVLEKVSAAFTEMITLRTLLDPLAQPQQTHHRSLAMLGKLLPAHLSRAQKLIQDSKELGTELNEQVTLLFEAEIEAARAFTEQLGVQTFTTKDGLMAKLAGESKGSFTLRIRGLRKLWLNPDGEFSQALVDVVSERGTTSTETLVAEHGRFYIQDPLPY